MNVEAGNELPATKQDVVDAIDSLRRDQRARMDSLDRKIDRVAVEVVRSQSRLRAVEENMATKDRFRKYMEAVHDFASKAETYGRTAVLHGQALTEDRISIKDHERRLQRLES